MDASAALWGYDSWTHTEVVPKKPPIHLRWYVGPFSKKSPHWHHIRSDTTNPYQESEFIVQLTADQQVTLTVEAQDAYGNPVDISGANPNWTSSDDSIISVTGDGPSGTAVAVGPVGTASVTVASQDGTLQGSLAIDVVAGDVTEIVITAGEPTDKNVVDNTLPAPEAP